VIDSPSSRILPSHEELEHMSMGRAVSGHDGRGLSIGRWFGVMSVLPLAAACSASDGGGQTQRVGAREPGVLAPPPSGGEEGGTTPEASDNNLDGLVEESPTTSGAVAIEDACIVSGATAEIVTQPVDIILLLDNSGSMEDELGAVEANVNVNFASILANSDVDYRVILISRHRREPRTASSESSTSICVSAPLSGAADCTASPEPVLSERFFQYSTKVESTDSFDILLDTFAPPFESSDREEKFDNAPIGWSAWLRPGAKRVFLELTDDNEDMPLADFLRQLVALSPSAFGSDPAQPNIVFHSIIGVAEKADTASAYTPDEPLQNAICTGNGNVVENSGLTYQELSRLTGGLRFPLCQFGAYDVVFRRIAEDVVLTSSIACDFAIPPAPMGSALDLANVAIRYTPGGSAAPVTFGQAPASSACQADAFYISGDRLNLCPEACSRVRLDAGANLSVLFTCESQLIVPR
jgi:hypothetical protein